MHIKAAIPFGLLAQAVEVVATLCAAMHCRLLNIEDLQNAELWQKAGLLAADPNQLVA